jgi:uncharacterized protein YydD (DUF2326 family)
MDFNMVRSRATGSATTMSWTRPTSRNWNALAESHGPEMQRLHRVYQDLGVTLGDQVRRRFEEVSAFHQSVVRNRRTHLSGEVEAANRRLAERKDERARLGERLRRILTDLREGGALEALTGLQAELGQREADLAQLRARQQAAQALETSTLEIQLETAQLRQQVELDLNEREEIIDAVTGLFRSFVTALYSDNRTAFIKFEAGASSLRITQTIESDDSRGIGNMVIFYFDLAVFVTAHRAGRAPDLLIHDSHLFDGVDDRQLAAALRLARRVTHEESMQYIATLNSDDLNKARDRGFEPDDAIIEPRLTDADPTGGLFGFRF